MQSFHIKAISYRPQAQFSPAETESAIYTIAIPPTSVSLLAPACHCDLSQHTVYHHKPTYQQRLLAHVECLPTVHTGKEALAPCALVTKSK